MFELEDEEDESSYCASSSGLVDESEDTEEAELGPIYKSWCSKSSSSEDFVQVATNFTIAEFKALWASVQDIICLNWNVGSGRRSNIHPMDALLMVLTQLKQGGTFAHTDCWFGCLGNKFRRLIEGFIKKCGNNIYNLYLSYLLIGISPEQKGLCSL